MRSFQSVKTATLIQLFVVVSVIIQMIIAIKSDGLTRSLAELSAFLLILSLVLYRVSKKLVTGTKRDHSASKQNQLQGQISPK